MDPKEVSSALHRIFLERLAVRVEDCQADLFETGLVDSLGFVDLVAAVEQEFGIEIDLVTVDLAHFQTFDSLTRFIGQQTG